jgi:hypothetical protein
MAFAKHGSSIPAFRVISVAYTIHDGGKAKKKGRR